MKNSSIWLTLCGLVWSGLLYFGQDFPEWVNVILSVLACICLGVALMLTEDQNERIAKLEKEIKELTNSDDDRTP